MVSLAGAFHTPRVSSVRAQTPAMWPRRRDQDLASPLVPIGFSTLIQG